MALENILEKIAQDAGLEKERILNSASKEADSILDQISQDALRLKEDIIKKEREKEEHLLKKEIIARNLATKKEILDIKRRCLDDCFKEAQERLFKIDDNLYKTIISKMLQDIKEEAEVFFSKSDSGRITESFLHRINPGLKLAFSNDIKAGFVAKTRYFIMDYSFENMLADLRNNLEPKAAQMLFGE